MRRGPATPVSGSGPEPSGAPPRPEAGPLRPARASAGAGTEAGDTVPGDALRRFREAYASHRAAEGRGSGGAEELLSLPYLRTGPQARQWRVRARTFDRFLSAVIRPAAREAGRPLRVLDLGAGNGWLCHRLVLMGHRAVAADVRVDRVDGLGAAAAFAGRVPRLFERAAASFEELPFPASSFDIAVFNAAIHYALDLGAALGEAARVVRPGGRIAILDSPFYRSAEDGRAMVAEKHRQAGLRFGDRAGELLALPFVEFLTPGRLAAASEPLGLRWRRRRVLYPAWYEARPLVARIRRRRPPSRFDLWEARVPGAAHRATPIPDRPDRDEGRAPAPDPAANPATPSAAQAPARSTEARVP